MVNATYDPELSHSWRPQWACLIGESGCEANRGRTHWNWRATGQTHSHHRSGDKNVFARLPFDFRSGKAF